MTFLASNVSFDLLNSKSLPYGGLKFKYSFKMHQYLIAVGLHCLPNWQDRCHRASRELFSNYLLDYSDNKYMRVSIVRFSLC